MTADPATVVVVPRAPRPAPTALPERIELADLPRPEDPSAAQSWVQALLLAGGGLGGVLFVMVNPRPLYVFAGCVLLVATVGGTAGYTLQQRGRGRRRRRRDRAAYLRHLARVRRVARRVRELDHRHRTASHPPADLLAPLARGPRTWERRPGDPDFLQVRIGTGTVPAAGRPRAAAGAPDDRDPVLTERVQALVQGLATLSGTPVALDLGAARRVTVDDVRVLRALVAQAVLWHTPDDLELAVATHPDRLGEWSWVGWLPHAVTASGRRRVTTSDAESLLAERLRSPLPGHLLLVVDGAALPESGALADLAERDPGRVTVLELVDPAARPVGWADVAVRAGEVVGPAAPAVVGPVEVDGLSEPQAALLARRLAPCRYRIGPADRSLSLLRRGGLPALLGVGDLATWDRDTAWAPRAERDRLRVPIGVGADGSPVHLDLKESATGGMGPHGLIVGATGSGKSELLRTLVTALALTHPPEVLSFVLVDFKGGATFAGLAGLPHLGGLITNLEDDASMVGRAQDALAGELQRRQQLLRDADVSSLAEYARRPDLPALPSLLVVVDEFSELLVQRPEFADLFAAIGRLGRSLGVHLLVASQRLEEGRLRGLESHLGFRIALRTFSPADSATVISVRDAFHLPRTPGAGFLRVGSGELLRFDAAHVSAAARPVDDRAVAVVEPHRWLPLDAPDPGRGDDHADDAGGASPFETMTQRLADPARRAHQVWLDPLPGRIALGGVLDSRPWRDDRTVQVPIGIVDRPREQTYGAFVLDLAGSGGHALVVGAPRSGRTTLLATLALGLAATRPATEAQLYVVDLGGRLGVLDGLPHVGGVAPRTDPERVRATVGHVLRVLHRREEQFPERGITSVADLRAGRAAGRLTGPDCADVVLLVDGLAELRGDHPELEDAVLEIAARGLGYGVHLVTTANRWGDVRPALRELVPARVELRLTEPADSVIDRKQAAAVPSGAPGRGLVTGGLHLQVLLPLLPGTGGTGDDDAGLRAAVTDVAARHTGPTAPPVLTLPTVLSGADLLRLAGPDADTGVGAGIAVGVGERDLEPVRLALDATDPHLVVFGDSGSGKTSVLRTVARGVAARGAADHALYVVDYRRTLADVADDVAVAAYAPTPGAVAELVDALVAVLRARMPSGRLSRQDLRDRGWWDGPEEYVLVDDLDLVESVQGNPLAPLADFVPHAADIGLHLVVARRVAGASRHSPLLGRLADFGAPGIVLSGDRAEGPLLGGVRAEIRPPGRGMLVRRGRPAGLVQTVRDDGDPPAVGAGAVRAAVPIR